MGCLRRSRPLSSAALALALVLVSVAAGAAAQWQLYKTLGLPARSSAAQIKSAYRKMALRWHPDKNRGDREKAAQKKFVEISHAYEVLSDKEQKAKYDRTGREEELEDHGQRRGGGQGGFGGDDFFSMFRNARFGGGGRGGHFGGGGRPRRGPSLFDSSAPGVEELSKEGWEELMVESAARRSAVVLFYLAEDGDGDDGGGLKQLYADFAKRFAGPLGYVRALALNCGGGSALSKICDQHGGGSDLPAVVYFGPGGSSRRYERGERLSSESLVLWAARVQGDRSTVLRDEAALRAWVAANDSLPHVVFVTDRKTTPPLLKALSVDFSGRAGLGIVRHGAESSLHDLLGLLGVARRPALLDVLDEDTLDSRVFAGAMRKEPMSYFISRAVARHRAELGALVRELTPRRFAAGDCAAGDSSFCLLLLSAAGDLGTSTRAALRQVAQRFRSDPIKAFFVRDRGFVRQICADVSPGRIVLFRPKRRRYQVYQGDPTDVEALASFVVDTALSGNALPHLLSSQPTMRQEL